jgi:CRP/FNR family transcriptional regulator, cyclic AMP receptor protein
MEEEFMMRNRRVHQCLTEIPLFSACSGRELEEVSSLFSAANIPAGKMLTEEGQPGREFVVIVQGQAMVAVHGVDIITLGPGDFFGEIALLDRGPRTATVSAVTDLAAEVMSAREFAQMLDDVPGLGRSLLVGMAARLRDADVRLTA